MSFRFASPWVFLFVPLVVWVVRAGRSVQRQAALPLANAGALGSLGHTRWARLHGSLPGVRGVALVLLLGALARPQAGWREEQVATEGVDIVVALDISGSMRAMDLRPNRLEAARRTVQAFVEGRPQDRIGLVVFAAFALTRCPLTVDHGMLLDTLERVDFAPREQDGTALGMGLATAVERLRRSEAKSKVVLLVTDGRNNRGQISPQAAAEAARALGVRVHTIGVGTEGPAPVPVEGPFGLRYTMQPLDLDEPVLRAIAEATQGRYFRATDQAALEEVFRTIDALEKTRLASRVRVLYSERFPWLLVPALALLGGEAALRATRLRRIP